LPELPQLYLIMKPYHQLKSLVNPDSNKIHVDLGTLDRCVGIIIWQIIISQQIHELGLNDRKSRFIFIGIKITRVKRKAVVSDRDLVQVVRNLI